ncbi:hypothetical protein NN561_020238 [Cricetulus griseus]
MRDYLEKKNVFLKTRSTLNTQACFPIVTRCSFCRFKAVPRLGQYQGFGHRLTPQNVAAASKLCEDVMIDVPEEQQPSDAGQQEDSEDTLTSRDTLSTAKLCEDATVDIQEEQEPPDTSTDS